MLGKMVSRLGDIEDRESSPQVQYPTDTHIHDCSLKDEPHYLTNRISSPDSFAFRARTWFLIDPEHPQTKRFYSSSYMFRTELIRHIKSDYWFIIHPFSRFRFYWDIWLLFYFYGLMIATPLTIAFVKSLRHSSHLYYVTSIVDVLAGAELTINCITGYSTDKYYRNIRLSPWAIFKNYLSGMFVIDCLFAFPKCTLAKIFDMEEKIILDAINVVLLLKLFSVRYIWIYLTNLFERFRIDMLKYYILRLMMISTLFLHWSVCFYKMMITVMDDPEVDFDEIWHTHVEYLRNVDNGIFERYGKCCSTVMYYVFPRSFGELGIPKTFFAKSVVAVCIAVGISFYFYLILQIYKLITIMSSTKRKYAEMISQLQAYMKMKQFPVEMKNRLLYYYEKKFEKCYFAEEKILQTLSNSLRNQIVDHNASRFFEQVFVLRDVPRHILLPLVRSMEKEIYLPNDMVIKAGTSTSKVYFIQYGSVAVYTQSGKEIGHISDGDHFGEIALFYKSKRLVNIVAIEFSKIFVLRRKVFLDLIPPESEFYQRLEQIAKERMQNVLLEEEQYKSHLLMVNAGNE
ncbi:potassium/sodium hyperpolarization-activated cyclic nucleotide-gated channel 2-like [Malaya genurostris]|uniref:potassium/sodium hyperpolarization-activated cyclic nucleotide-gated channel 2-like n=1 Tax=Malaya genurostris TaxID=325434 RepID=UPI0026F3F77F|nr:potassium/sodium hyperpolarization-activated cyclic nucleotide-gated channel 2-like [Malaya genurostris]